MTERSVLVIAGTIEVTVGPLTLWERAVLVADRVGLAPIRLWSRVPVSSSTLARRGVRVHVDHADAGPFALVDPTTPVIVIGPDVLADAASLIALSTETERGSDAHSIVVRDHGIPILLWLSARHVAAVRTCDSLEAAVRSLAAMSALRELGMSHFCRYVADRSTAGQLERDLIRHLNGGKRESFFTKIIRRFSVPLSIRLARLGAQPTEVTLAGLMVAIGSAWCISQGSYLAGLAGAILYYVSMVLDCSDGEVARLAVRDSDFGAWIETMVDYTTYVLLLGGLTLAVRDEPGHGAFEAAALIAAIGSMVVAAVATYLRHRVAYSDPGQFDDSSAKALKSAGRIHRFARWGRQWIKRSTIAHLVVALALINQLNVLLFLWAFGAAVASIVIVAVAPFVVRRVSVTRLAIPGVRAR
jgi:phosphatidylglycerophosphate synthase